MVGRVLNLIICLRWRTSVKFLSLRQWNFGLQVHSAEQVHSLFQSQFSIQCDLALPLSVYSILFFLMTIQWLLTSSSSFPLHVYSSLCISSITCCTRQFVRKMWPIQLALLLLNLCRIFFSSLTICNTLSCLIGTVHLIFSVLHQYHILRLLRNFWSTLRSVRVSAPYETMLQK
jgi:hypothetical protein